MKRKINQSLADEILRLLSSMNGVTISRENDQIVAKVGQLRKELGNVEEGMNKCGVNLVA